MASKPASLVLLICAVLSISTAFATTKKFQRSLDRSGDRSDKSLQSGILPDTGSSVSSGAGSASPSNVLQGGSFPFLSLGTPDNWNGGTGTWSNAGDWNSGVPGANSDVTIYSGGNDLVTLDLGSTTVNSLTLGGANNGTTSELTDGGIKQTLTIAQGMTIGETGELNLSAVGSAFTADADSSNAGQIQLSNGSTLAISGTLDNSGTVDLENASVLTVTGDVNNTGTLGVSFNGGGTGGNTVTINGALTNSGTFEIAGPGDMASIGSLTNSGTVDLENASVLTVTGDVNNSGTLATNGFGLGGGNTVNVNGTLTNSGTFEMLGPVDEATLGGLTNSGTADVENGSTLTINGAVDNTGTLATNGFGLGGGNTVTVNGLLTNEATGQINLSGPGDVLQALAGLSNNGVINVNNGSSIVQPFVNNGGAINIDSLSKMVVGTGNPMGLGYIQLANGTLGEIINPTSYGVINVNGSALLDGTLDILLKPGFDPAVGSTYKFLFANAGQINGVFASILNDIFNGGTEKWLVTYDSGDGYVELTAANNGNQVPEPDTLLLLMPGLMGMAFGLRRSGKSSIATLRFWRRNGDTPGLQSF